MLLAVDIGNSNIHFGVFEADGTLRAEGSIAARTPRSPEEYAVLMEGILHLRGVSRGEVTEGILSSVVPSLSAPIRAAVHLLFGIPLPEVGAGMKTGLRIHVDDPSQLGADLVANAVAAATLLPPPFAVVDAGSATTFTVVDAAGTLCGVVIAPGVGMSFRALANDAARLSDVPPLPPHRLLGKNTRDAVGAGVLRGHAMMVDGMLRAIAQELGAKELPAALTGGYAAALLPLCGSTLRHLPSLTLEGLFEIARKNRK